MSIVNDSKNDDSKPYNAPTKSEFESFASRLIAVPKLELDGLIAERRPRRRKRKMRDDSSP